MITVHEKVLKSFKETDNFNDWKYNLRQYDITCDVVNALDGVPQYTYHHPEFDALKHTYYVCRALLDIVRPELLEAGFLHDYGKGFTTNVGSKRIYHFGHARVSAEYVNSIKDYLKDYELTYRIVKHHMDYNVGDKALQGDEFLRSFVLCDKVMSKKIYDVEASFIEKIGNKVRESLTFLKQRTSSKKLYVMIGIPGSGKSRYLKDVDSDLVVSSDSIRRELFGDVNTHKTSEIPAKEIWDVVKARLRYNLEVRGVAYMDATNVSKFHRVEFMASFNDARKIAVVFEVDPEVAKSRIKADIENGVDRSNVPEKAVDKMYKVFTKGRKSLDSEFNKVIYYT